MNIEKTISEHAVSDILTPMLESQDRIVTEDVAPLFDQATGLDTPPASGTVTTTIEESRSVITAIIRKAWTATLTMLGGASVLSSLAAAYTYLRTRLQGNETYGIPDRRSEISASSPLAANLALLNDRKINGVPEAADGMSIFHLLLDTSAITELQDDNEYTIQSTFPLSLFPNVETFVLSENTDVELDTTSLISGFAHDVLTVYGLRKATGVHSWNIAGLFSGTYKKVYAYIKEMEYKPVFGNSQTALEEIYLPELTRANCILAYVTSGYWTEQSPNLTKLYVPKLREAHNIKGTGNAAVQTGALITSKCEALTKLEFPVLEEISGAVFGSGCVPNLTELRMPSLKKVTGSIQLYANNQVSRQNLAIIEVGAMETNLDLSWWNPTNVLQNNLQQFLSNFRDYIADKLKGGYPIGQGPILTLSQAVRNAIHAAEATYGIENIIITQKGWTISPAPN